MFVSVERFGSRKGRGGEWYLGGQGRSEPLAIGLHLPAKLLHFGLQDRQPFQVRVFGLSATL
jgi:hypothetical protein